jgi:MFS superfamily sulfate permease-like transporter
MEAALKKSIAAALPAVEHVLLDFSAVNDIDVSACDELIMFIKKLKNQRVSVAFARVRDTVRRDLQLGKIEAVVDAANFHERITDGITAWQRRRSEKAD